jgi:hypothetical protein
MLLASVFLLSLVSTIRPSFDSVVLAQLPLVIPQFSNWSNPVNVGPNVNSASSERQVSITHQGLSLYFDSDRPGGFGANDLYVSQRPSIDAAWGPAMNLGSRLNSLQAEFAPNFSPDDHWIFFASSRPGGFGNLDIWAAYRPDISNDFGWETPINLGPSINTSFAEADAFYFIDSATGETTLFFTSLNRPGGFGDWDIYQSAQNADGSFNPAVRVAELSSPFRDTRMAIRYDGLEVIFSSNRPGGSGGIDLWFSTRQTTADTWSMPANLGPMINTSTDDRAPYLSADGETLFFSSDRVSPFGGGDIWMTTRTQLPVVMTRNIVVPANYSCAASITPTDVDDGSFDPDSQDTFTLSLDHSGPFSLGSQTVTLTATDNHGATNSSTAIVTVIDQTPPAIIDAAVDKSTLWPANHRLVDVAVSYAISDNCGPVDARLSITSNEPVNGEGDGDMVPDWELVNTHQVRLRAERSGGGSGRIYNITISATDSFGNVSSQTLTVNVPHD